MFNDRQFSDIGSRDGTGFGSGSGCVAPTKAKQSWSNELGWARRCVDRINTDDPHSAAKVQMAIDRFVLAYGLELRFRDPASTFVIIGPFLWRAVDGSVEIPTTRMEAIASYW